MNSVDSTTIFVLIIAVCLIFVVIFMCFYQIFTICRENDQNRENDCGWEWCGTLHGGWLRQPEKSQNSENYENFESAKKVDEIKENNFLNFTLKDYLTDRTLDARSDSVQMTTENSKPGKPEKLENQEIPDLPPKLPQRNSPKIVKPVLPNRNYQSFTCIQQLVIQPEI